jgi:hypothetical protein
MNSSLSTINTFLSVGRHISQICTVISRKAAGACCPLFKKAQCKFRKCMNQKEQRSYTTSLQMLFPNTKPFGLKLLTTSSVFPSIYRVPHLPLYELLCHCTRVTLKEFLCAHFTNLLRYCITSIFKLLCLFVLFHQ